MSQAGLVIPITAESVGPLRERLRTRELLPSDYPLLDAILDSLLSLADVLSQKDLSIRKLRRLLFGPSTEKTRNVIQAGKEEASSEGHADEDRPAKARGKRKGHGRNGVEAYPGAERIPIPLVRVTRGQLCPECKKGTIYILREPGQVCRVSGQPMLAVVIYELEKGRPSACGAVFTAELPPEAGPEKFDARAGAMVAVSKYGRVSSSIGSRPSRRASASPFRRRPSGRSSRASPRSSSPCGRSSSGRRPRARSSTTTIPT